MNKKTHLTVRLDDELHAAVRALAERQRRTMSQVVRMAIEDYCLTRGVKAVAEVRGNVPGSGSECRDLPSE